MKKEITLTNAQRDILNYLITNKEEGFISPTKMGLHFGYDYESASSRVCPKLKFLVKQGLVVRNEKGHYKYEDTDKKYNAIKSIVNSRYGIMGNSKRC